MTFRAVVIETTQAGVWVQVNRGWHRQVTFGPCPTLVPNLLPGTPVLVGELDGSTEKYAVLGEIVAPIV